MKLNKGIAVLAAFVFTFAASASQAQTAGAGAIAGANSSSQSASGSAAQSNNSLTFNTPSKTSATNTIRTEGSTTTRVENAPSLGGLALGGGHPCAYSPTTAQISIIGGGAGYGGMQVDTACMLLIQAAARGDTRAYNAAMYMLAARDPEACVAMYRSGMVDDCVDKQGRSTVKAAPATSSRNRTTTTAPKLFTSCRYDEAKNQIMVKFTAAGRKDKVTAGLACQRSLGM